MPFVSVYGHLRALCKVWAILNPWARGSVGGVFTFSEHRAEHLFSLVVFLTRQPTQQQPNKHHINRKKLMPSEYYLVAKSNIEQKHHKKIIKYVQNVLTD